MPQQMSPDMITYYYYHIFYVHMPRDSKNSLEKRRHRSTRVHKIISRRYPESRRYRRAFHDVLYVYNMYYRAGYKSHRRTVYISRIMIIIIDVNASKIKTIIFYFIYSLRRRHHRYCCRDTFARFQRGFQSYNNKV